MKVSKVRQKTIVEQVMDQIKNLIASGQLKPHDKIPPETELAQMFGIGRSSVREAIKIFQYLGILEASPRKGTFVCDYTNISSEALTWSIVLRNNDIYELVELREVIEGHAVGDLTDRVAADPAGTQPTIAALGEVIARMEQAVSAASIEDIVSADYEFHRLIIRSCDNTLFSNIYDTLRAFMLDEIRKTNLLDSAGSDLVPGHQAILVAIASGDRESAGAAFRVHIGAVRQQLRRSLAMN
jgi:DNA-binding FadR family transcriptional regulator